MDNELKKELCTAIANTSFAMLVLLKQLHSELGHAFDMETCIFCSQYINQSAKNRALVERAMKGEQ